MSSTFLIQGQVNTPDLLSFFYVDDDGFLADVNSIQVEIFGPDGVLFYGPVDVTTIGKFGTGSYYVVDLFGGPWQAPSVGTPGTWKCLWSYTLEPGGPTFTWTQRWVLEESSLGFEFGYRTLISPSQVRAEGISDTILPNSRLGMLIDLCQQYIETKSGTYFRPIPSELKINALFSEAMMLNIPVIGVEYVKPNGSSTPLNKSSYAVNNYRVDLGTRFNPQPDPRRNPYIRFRSDVSIFASVGGLMNRQNPRFAEGPKLQRIGGVFGWLESDGTVPALVTRAMMIMIYNNAIALSPGGGPQPAGPIISETVDRHTVMYSASGSTSKSWSLATSKEVEEVINMYRRPIGMGTTAPTWPLPLVR